MVSMMVDVLGTGIRDPLWRENPGFGIWFFLFGFRFDSAFSSFEIGFWNLETSK